MTEDNSEDSAPDRIRLHRDGRWRLHDGSRWSPIFSDSVPRHPATARAWARARTIMDNGCFTGVDGRFTPDSRHFVEVEV